MKTLIIYDNTGKIFYQASGSVTEPTGLPFLWEEIPTGKYAESVDVTDPKTPIAVLVDLPISENERLRADIDYLLALQQGV